MIMSPGLTYWIVAWSMMGLAFMSAFLAILLGARGLDRLAPPVNSDNTGPKNNVV